MAEAILIWIWSFVFYIEKFITPWLLLPHYELPQPVLWNHPLYISAMILFLVFVYSIYRFRHNRYYVFAWAYYFLSIFFVLKTSPETSIGNLSLLGDRFMYLPCLGFCLWIGVSIDGLWQARKSKFTKAIPVCVAILFCLLAVKTYWQTKIWKNDITLWSYVIEKNPQDPLAYVNRAFAYEKQGQYDLAIADNSKAIGINPGYYVSTLAEDLPVDNEQREKIDQINTRLLNNPYYVEALRNRGKIYKTIQQNNLALKDFNEALQINPKDIEIRTLRSQIQIQK